MSEKVIGLAAALAATAVLLAFLRVAFDNRVPATPVKCQCQKCCEVGK